MVVCEEINLTAGRFLTSQQYTFFYTSRNARASYGVDDCGGLSTHKTSITLHPPLHIHPPCIIPLSAPPNLTINTQKPHTAYHATLYGVNPASH